MSNTNADTDAVPVVEPAVDGARELERTSTAETPPRGLRARLAASVADPVLRILVISTAIGRIGRGVFLTITVLYFTLIVGLSPVQVAIVLTVASAVGVASSAVGGQLADRFSARRQLVVCMALQGVGLIAYVFATSFPAALVIGALVGGVDAASNATRMAIIARAFEGPARVNAACHPADHHQRVDRRRIGDRRHRARHRHTRGVPGRDDRGGHRLPQQRVRRRTPTASGRRPTAGAVRGHRDPAHGIRRPPRTLPVCATRASSRSRH